MKKSLPVGTLLTPPEIFRGAGRHASDKVIAEAAGVAKTSNSLSRIKSGRHPVLAGLGFNWSLIKGPILPVSLSTAPMLDRLVIQAGVLPTTAVSDVDLPAAAATAVELTEREQIEHHLLDDRKPLLDRVAALYAASIVNMAIGEAPTASSELEEVQAKLDAYVSDHRGQAAAILEAASSTIGRESFDSGDSDLLRRQELGRFITVTKLRTNLAISDAAAAERGDLDAALKAIPWILVEDNLLVLRQVGDESTARRLLQIASAGDSLSLAVEVAASLLDWNMHHVWLDDAPDWQGRSWALHAQDRFVTILNRVWASKLGRERLEPLLTGPRVRKITAGHGIPKIKKFDAFRELHPIHAKTAS